ncbi:MAG: hypothetical protein JWO92_2517 [Chitinophagaceae bacterium]|nr:hypothetical protein [Chitinophagaceae bacterium]
MKIGVLEEKFLTALEDVRIDKASTDAISQVLRRCMLKVGMRANNLPNNIESVVLYEHLINFYGGLKLEELKLAFDLATSGQIEVPDTFENFSCSYLSKVLNAYRTWASKKYTDNLGIIEKPKLENKPSGIDWRESIQNAYEGFMNGKAPYRLWVVEMYDQLVYDDFIPALYYKEFDVKNELLQAVHKEIIQVEKKIDRNEERYLGVHKDLQNKLIEYRNGSRDAEVLLLSKQTAILKYFETIKERNVENIYKKEL